GQKAVAIGNALGKFSNTVTVGIVSGLARRVTASGAFGENAKTYNDVIQTDAALNPGNSGGPLLNLEGQVIGVNVATTRGADNIGFAIPVNSIKPILDSFKEAGRIIKPYLGVSFEMITRDLAEFGRYPEGAFVSRVGENSPAEKSGIKRGDVITKLDGRAINERNPLDSEIQQKHKVGDSITLTIDRRGEEIKLEAVLEEYP
ncbi:PDZ domain-containing protein, partial [candidate division WWE3 bacterium]|nr:PDZ domain-containing protein [candidate division WWE3 bacterium]